MYNCFDIAKEILNAARAEGYSVEPMKLLKLTYIAHGYYLGFYSKPLFTNEVQAWKYGPVIPELYHVTKRFGSRSVDSELIDLYSENKLSQEDKAFIKLVWDAYKMYNGIQLSTMTHQPGTPWARVYEEGVFHNPIYNSVIENYYKQMIDERSRTGKQ